MAEEKITTPAGAEEAMKEQVEEKLISDVPGRKLFGTFSGVFTPTLLTILGVIMYLREGWVVGNAGLLGAWLIILGAFAITGCTALSLASITTNIRIGSGGAFSIISQSLGLEVGGSIGVPLYVSQALAVAMYVFGFRAGWTWVFPDHPALVVDLLTFGVLFVIGFISAGLAFKIQYVILVIIIGSLISVGATVFMDVPGHAFQWWGEYPGSPETGFQGIGFWAVFAVFFPASTGIMAGANMSGELKNPRKAIPIGTLSAIAISLVVYLALAWWLAVSAPTEELTSNYTVMIDRAAWGPAVLAGLLGATFSSALSSLVGAPRILQALAEHRIMPGSSWLTVRTAKGEPRNAMLLTGLIVLGALMLRNLNAIAPLITMFFLITYATINAVVLLEQSLRLVSFRPLFRISRLVSLSGAVGCVLVMLIVNPLFGVAALGVVLALHAYLIKKRLAAPFADVRSGLFTAVAEWAAKKVVVMSGPKAKTWKANLLVPVEDSSQVKKLYPLLRDLAAPKGFVRLLGLTGRRNYEEMTTNLPGLMEQFQKDDIFATWTVVEAASFSENLAAGIEALGGAFFQSSVIVLRYPTTQDRAREILRIIKDAKRYGLGVALLSGTEGELPEQGGVHVVLDRPKEGWTLGRDMEDADLAVLIAYKLKTNWSAPLSLTALVDTDAQEQKAVEYLHAAMDLARIPNASIGTVREKEELPATVGNAVRLTLFSMDENPDLERIAERTRAVGTPCLFVLDSGWENALV
ncbi:MAG: amino acid permease [Desulfohalobiaceae bacterium]